MTAAVVTVTTLDPIQTDTYTDVLALVVVLSDGDVCTLADPAVPYPLFASTLRELADRLESAAPASA